MYLTQIKLNLNNHLLFKNLTSRSEYHAWLSSAFSSLIILQQKPKFLWRIDLLNKKPIILLVSENEPNKEILMKYATDVKTIDYQKFIDKLQNEQTLRFCLTGNPVQHKNNKRFVISKVNEQLKWLNYQADRFGFEITQANIARFEDSHINKYNFTVRAVTFTGILKITDVDKFKQALVRGSGHEKAYGCGLLTVA